MNRPSGTVIPLVRQLAIEPDPLALYRDLADQPHTFLLESADRAQGSAARSIVAVSTALHLTADLAGTTVTPRNVNGEAIVEWVGERLGGRATAGGGLFVPTPSSLALEEEARFRRPSPFDCLRLLATQPSLTSRPSPWCHLLAGVVGYDAIDYFERLPAGIPAPHDEPLLEWWVPDGFVVIDHAHGRTTVITTAWGGSGAEARYHDAASRLERLVGQVMAQPAKRLEDRTVATVELDDVTVDQDDDAFAATVRRLQREIALGEIYQVVPSRTFSLPCADPLGAYRELRGRNPSPYLFFFRGPERVLFGASPETCLRIDGPSRTATITPIAGTARRGFDHLGRPSPEADARLELSLRHDPKEQAEHCMLVDLARNDVARIAKPGTRRVTRLLEVERYAHVMHLVSEVSGVLRPEVDPLEALAATLPMGTLSGAPKIRAAELLREVEPSRRGCYGGGVGYFRHDGTLETAIVIRSAVVTDGVARVRAGAGVVLDSDPVAEAAETSRKAQAVLEAIAVSQTIGVAGRA